MENIIYSPSGHVSIRINDDKMSAWMYIHKSGEMIDEREILNLIKDAGICNGFEDALEWMSTNGYNKDFDKPFPVAICKAALNKEELSYKFDPEKSYKPDSDWNFKDIANWTFVPKGALLAEVSINLFNEQSSAYNIYGELSVDAVNTSLLSDYLGQNVSLDEDNQSIRADISGYPYLNKDSRICVTDQLVFKGDIKLVKIPTTIPVALTVEGNINKAHMSTEKDLIVKGNLVGAEIFCEGNLTVEGSIIECQTTGIVVSKNLKVKSISSSLVLCKGQLNFETTINNSRVVADKNVLGDPELSLIKASQVLTAGTIDIADAGDEEGNETELESTTSPFTKERISQLAKMITGLKENEEANKERIEIMKNKIRKMDDEFSLDLSNYLNKPDTTGKCVKIRNEVFKGVYIRVMKNSWQIKTNQSNVEFTAE